MDGEVGIRSAGITPHTVAVRWEDGTAAQFHHVWLRDNCPCTQCRHAEVGERLSVEAGGHLDLTWPDGHRSRFSAAWLAQHAYERDHRVARRPQRTLWDTNRMRTELPEVDFADVMSGDDGLVHWLGLLRRYGFCIVRQMPTADGTVLELARRVGNLRDSNFGLLWQVESRPVPDSLAYTSVKLTAHTDLVSREAQPGLQFLHCLVNDSTGGESILVDGFAVAEELRRTEPAHWVTLTSTPVAFRYQSPDTDVSAAFPVIRLDADGGYYEVRYSNALMAPLAVDHDRVLPFYAAYRAFSELLRDPRFELSFRLGAGDCEVFDNRRVLHGRQEFDPQTGPRHLQGCYVDTDDWLSRLRVLQRTQDFRLR
jgi:gamma-butyrobetaine dioxygenase